MAANRSKPIATASSETIAAIATAAGAAGIGVVRVSGPLAAAMGETLAGRRPKTRKVYLSTFCDGDGTIIDRGLVLYFAAPRSYTGEDVLELHAHGNAVVLGQLLRRVCALGARPARPGEFTERAFLNGKLDLAQAEAVADLIASGSQAAAQAAIRSLQGEFSNAVRALFDGLVNLRVWLEAALDFPDEDVDFLAAPELAQRLQALCAQNVELIAATRRGIVLRDGLHVVIVGRPNVGKSSLLNVLAQDQRAIVTPIAGTTRDVLRETIELDGVTLTLVDTAGLHESDDLVEREGMQRARAELARADVVILVTDGAFGDADAALLRDCAEGVVRILVHNKIDLGNDSVRQEIDKSGQIHIFLSAQRGDGVDLLRAELRRLAGRDEGTQGSFSARTRHLRALDIVTAHLGAARIHLNARTGELAAEELRLAQRALGEITGEYTSDDLLGEIFSGFCIGK